MAVLMLGLEPTNGGPKVQPDHVLVKLRCNVRRQELEFCVRVNRGVPETLRCTPGGGGGGGAGGAASPVCDDCTALLEGDRLSRRVNELTQRGWSDHLRAGAVVVTC